MVNSRAVASTCAATALRVVSRSAMTIADLPALNASLNFTSTVFLSLGWFFIRRGQWQRHMVCMISALVSSAIFLACYLIYHYYAREKSSGFHGRIECLYLPMPASHLLRPFPLLPPLLPLPLPVFPRRS